MAYSNEFLKFFILKLRKKENKIKLICHEEIDFVG